MLHHWIKTNIYALGLLGDTYICVGTTIHCGDIAVLVNQLFITIVYP